MSATATAVPSRAEVPFAETWALETVFPTEDAWEAAYAAEDARLRELEAYRGRISEGPETLLAALRLSDDLSENVAKVVIFAVLRRTEDATNTRFGEIADRAIGLASRSSAAAAFLGPEIAALSDETLAAWFAQEPGLEQYRQAIQRITRRREHIRSVEVEELLARAAEVAASSEITQSVLEDGELPLGEISDEVGRTVRLAQGNLQHYLDSADRRVRQDAWERSADAYLAFRNTFAATLAGAVKRDVFYARARGYRSSLESALSSDDVPTAVFYNLIDTVWQHFPVWRRYFNVRRRLLGLPAGELHGYDLEAPLADQPDFPWERGVDTILASLAPLGPEYVEEVRRGMAERWVDRAANIGKGGGAFSSGVYGTEPFISMTYQDTLTSVSTLTHEIGHSMHSLLTWRHQPVTYADYGMSAAETASNFNQALMGAHMLAENDERDWTIAVIEERMGNYQRYLFTMPILARFELAAHERVEAGNALSADWMSQTLLSYYREGYGNEVVIDTPRMGITWARFPHLFSNFYVFQYGVGISAAAALSDAVLTEGETPPSSGGGLGGEQGPPSGGDSPPDREGPGGDSSPWQGEAREGATGHGGETARERYLNFLRAGGSVDPIDGLREAGIDMSSPAPIERAFALMSSYIDRLESLVL